MSHGCNTPGRPGRTSGLDPLADAMADCCTYDPPGHMEEMGWWTLCPVHEAIYEVLKAAHPVIHAAVHPEKTRARRDAQRAIEGALSVVGARSPQDLQIWGDVPAAHRFLDALELL